MQSTSATVYLLAQVQSSFQFESVPSVTEVTPQSERAQVKGFSKVAEGMKGWDFGRPSLKPQTMSFPNSPKRALFFNQVKVIQETEKLRYCRYYSSMEYSSSSYMYFLQRAAVEDGKMA